VVTFPELCQKGLIYCRGGFNGARNAAREQRHYGRSFLVLRSMSVAKDETRYGWNEWTVHHGSYLTLQVYLTHQSNGTRDCFDIAMRLTSDVAGQCFGKVKAEVKLLRPISHFSSSSFLLPTPSRVSSQWQFPPGRFIGWRAVLEMREIVLGASMWRYQCDIRDFNASRE